MRRPGVWAWLVACGLVIVACGATAPSAAPSGSGPGRTGAPTTPAPSPTPTPVPSPIGGVVRWCDYVPGNPVTTMPPTVFPSVPPPTLPPSTRVDAATTRRQLDVLNELWRIVDRTHVDPEKTGDEWTAVRTMYRQVVQRGLGEEDFWTVLELMIYELGDDHSFLETPTEVAEAEAELEGEHDYAGIGALVQPTGDESQLVVIVTWPGSPAERAGLRSHDRILRVDGQLPVDDDGAARIELVRGPVGTTVTLTVQRSGEPPRDLPVERGRIHGPLPVDVCVIPGTRVLYVGLLTLFDRLQDDQIRDALEALEPGGPVDGIILDNRMNGGGAEDVLESVLAFFVDGPVGEFTSRDGSRRLTIDGVDVAGSQDAPVVVLVGLETASYGEVLSGVLQAMDGAKVVGETSTGNVESLAGHTLADGSRAWIAREVFEADDATYGPWEETGIIPDLVVPARWEDFTGATDPALPVALELLGLP